VADPLTVLSCCPTTDGAAAAVLMRLEDAKALKGARPVLLAGLGLSVSTGWDLPFFDPGHDFLGFRATREAARRAYGQAGITDPPKQIDLCEVHDCFTITEVLTYEDLGLCPEGQGGRYVQEGRSAAGGEVPVNVSGGLLSCGHPIGATGIRMVWEIAQHLRGDAGARQVKGAKLGVAHNIGGPGAVAAVTVLRAV
jgi:acetyl-CoA acetyltransferase